MWGSMHHCGCCRSQAPCTMRVCQESGSMHYCECVRTQAPCTMRMCQESRLQEQLMQITNLLKVFWSLGENEQHDQHTSLRTNFMSYLFLNIILSSGPVWKLTFFFSLKKNWRHIGKFCASEIYMNIHKSWQGFRRLPGCLSLPSPGITGTLISWRFSILKTAFNPLSICKLLLCKLLP